MNFLERPLEQRGGLHLKGCLLRDFNSVRSGAHLRKDFIEGGAVPFQHGADAAILHCLMGVAAGDDRQFELFGQRVGQPLGACAVQGDVLAVQVQEGDRKSVV